MLSALIPQQFVKSPAFLMGRFLYAPLQNFCHDGLQVHSLVDEQLRRAVKRLDGLVQLALINKQIGILSLENRIVRINIQNFLKLFDGFDGQRTV